ncbi:hypothetical protein VC83_02713 [Pseudogymnoascus destructans]|uniref:RWD domain-containing protein n=2 Tax=Pseudogymnoascus destructans TaxID=655981 RepID=L8G459_PSED2|nr:uncharacterized protein VC83_02713 [Pseudogymnoascus destructans]ELR07453.1 hypothetical protein GMDG_08422 [Pseudogymnoascus destructans 20631-21]OAF60887.1 hypothetical protein VC83_02713 [Pseudogymnoascus destructans]
MGREDQLEEREVLDSIFPDEITDISETSYTISILLDVTNEAGNEAEAPTVILKIEYPENYPDEAPLVEICAPDDAIAHELFDIEVDRERLIDALNDSIEENMGMAMIFTLVSTVKDAAEQIIQERQEVLKQEHVKRVMAIEAEENKKFHGTPVNIETFSKWRDAFRKEMDDIEQAEREVEEAAEKKRNRGKETEVKLTGRQLWESGMAGKADEDDDLEDAAVAAVEKVKF